MRIRAWRAARPSRWLPSPAPTICMARRGGFHTNQHLQSAGQYFRSSAYVKPLNILNIGGGNIGGPIKKDKLFYFFNFERTTERTGYSGNYSVAPADFRAGDFSKWTQYFLIY